MQPSRLLAGVGLLAGVALLAAACNPTRAASPPAGPTPSSVPSGGSRPAGPPAPSGSTNPSQAACTSPSGNSSAPVADPYAPHGIFVLAGAQPLSRLPNGQAIQQYLVNNPDVCGATIFVEWPLVDNGPGASPEFDWSTIDAAIAPWAQAGKVVNLLLDISGSGANVVQGVPAWLRSQVPTVTCGQSTTPVFWNGAFVTAWQRFVTAAVQHYGTDPNVGYMRVGTGTGAQTLVLGTQKPGPCLDSWNAAGYQNQWPAYVQQMITFAGGLHSRKQLFVSFNDYANYPAASEIYAWDAAAGLGTGFSGLQSFDVTAYQSGQPCGRQGTNWCALNQQYAGRVPIFEQTLGSTYPGPGVTMLEPNQQEAEETGPLPPLLQTAVATKVQVLEVYQQDLLLAFDPSWPGYSQYSAQYTQALASAAAVVGTAGGTTPAPPGSASPAGAAAPATQAGTQPRAAGGGITPPVAG